jgi:transcription elongation GreA/GreB family factor
VSVAFRREEDAESEAANLPDRPIASHPNLVTVAGLAQLDAALASARSAYAAAQACGEVGIDRTAMARATRDLRYYAARRASAQLTERDPAKAGVQFGDAVEILREDGRTQVFRVVGDDEADPAAGAVSYVSPLARAVLGRDVGETVEVAGRELEILAVRTG